MPRIATPTAEVMAEAAAALRSGRVVAFPTETVYGLGADTFNPQAIAAIYELKGRPRMNPLIAHVLDEAQAAAVASRWDDRATKLAAEFWPGPLTLVVPRRPTVPGAATANLNTIAVRAPAHPTARGLLKAFGGPISAPSANRSGHVSPTSARHVADDFADADDLLILDGGECEVGIESTVLDLSGPRPRILRPGSITAAMLRETIGEVETPAIDSQTISPGTSAAHYAPATPMELIESSEIESTVSTSPGGVVLLAIGPPGRRPGHRVIAMPADAKGYAHRLYGALREADASGAGRILVELPPRDSDLWRAVHDRLSRAASAQRSGA